jgi:hypothetical protein
MSYAGPVVPGMKFYLLQGKVTVLAEVLSVETFEEDEIKFAYCQRRKPWTTSLCEEAFREAVVAASDHPQPNVNRDFRWQQAYLHDGQRNLRLKVPCVCAELGAASYHYHADGSTARVWPVVIRPKWDQGREGCQPWPGDLEPPIVEHA